MPNVLSDIEQGPLVMHIQPVFELTDEQFFDLCQINRELRIERTSKGDLLIMPPTGGDTGRRNAGLIALLTSWSWEDNTGVTFDSSTGFALPNGAIRSPDAAWVIRSRLEALSDEQKASFLPLCPDFVVELRSPSDSLTGLQAKMQEYIDNGAQLGWLLDPQNRDVYVYRPNQPVEHLENVTALSGAPVLGGFVLSLQRIWELS
jgi:Uma2 family endonuclease